MGKIVLIKGNEERIAVDELQAQKFECRGFHRLITEEAEPITIKAFADMTAEELRAEAKKRGIKGSGALKKKDLLQILECGEDEQSGKTENPDEGE